MTTRRAVTIQVAGQNYRVVSSAEDEELTRLAGVVTSKIVEVCPPGRAPPNAPILAALALAHELELERARREVLERRTRDLLRRVLHRIDDALQPPDPTESQ